MARGHLLVLGHEPAFPVGGHKQDAMWWNGEIPEVNTMRERFWRTLSEHGVVAYISGDEHNYSRSLIGAETVEGATNPVWSIVSGGCGAPYYAQDTPEAYASRVRMFSAQQHYTLWTFGPGGVHLEVYGITGELIDDIWLDQAIAFGGGTVNERRLDAILPALDPTLGEREEQAVREVADALEAVDFFIVAHDQSGGVFRLTFADEDRQLTWSIDELVGLAGDLEESGELPLERELNRQGQR